MNKALFEDTKKVLRQIEGLPYWEAKLVLSTALHAIERHCYLNLDTFTEKNEVKDLDD